jgi:hypothetical protein
MDIDLDMKKKKISNFFLVRRSFLRYRIKTPNVGYCRYNVQCLCLHLPLPETCPLDSVGTAHISAHVSAFNRNTFFPQTALFCRYKNHFKSLCHNCGIKYHHTLLCQTGLKADENSSHSSPWYINPNSCRHDCLPITINWL